MQKEIWKDIPGYEGLYQVSSIGRVKSLYFNKEKILSQNKNQGGYMFIGIRKNKKSKTIPVHQLVAMAFLDHTPCGLKLVVNHINLNKTDNRVENLEIITQRENANHKHIKSTSDYVGVSWEKRSKKWRAAIGIDGRVKHLGLFDNETDAYTAYKNKRKEIEKTPVSLESIHPKYINILSYKDIWECIKPLLM